jgi:hypothetical protein
MANTEERLVELINLASIEVDGSKKVEYLYQIKELALNHGLLDRFFDDILAFQSDRGPNVKKFILAFIETACKHDFKFCPKSILSLNLLLNDTNNELIKRSTQVATHFYRALVQWIVNIQSTATAYNQQKQSQDTHNHLQPQQHNNITTTTPNDTGTTPTSNDPSSDSDNKCSISLYNDEIEKTWLMWLQIQSLICNLLESTNNDGVRTHCIKFIETVVLMQTPSDKDTDEAHKLNLVDPLITPVKLSDEATMCGVVGLPKDGVIFNQEHKLELVEAAKRRFEQLVVFHGTSHISSVNLMATMQSLVVLAKQRYRLFMGRVIQAMESLNNRLPPTLTESQVQSVKKFLKLQLTVMLKHPYSLDRYQLQLSQLLQAVGSKQPEIHKVINEYKNKFGCDVPTLNNNINPDLQKRIKLEPGVVKAEQKPLIGSQGSLGSQTIGKSKHLDLNKLTQELDEQEKRQIVVDSVKRILGDEKCINISPAQMEIKKKVLATLANEFNDTECPQIIQDYIFSDLKNRHEISYAIIKKTYEVAEAKALRRQIDLTDELLKDYFDCYSSYLSRAMELKDNSDREIILPNLYSLKNKFYQKSGVDMDDK